MRSFNLSKEKKETSLNKKFFYITDSSLLKQKDLKQYLHYSFLPIRYINDILEVGVIEKTTVDWKFLEHKFQAKIKIIKLKRQEFIKILQKNFSEYILHRASHSLAEKKPGFSAKQTLNALQVKMFFCIIALLSFLSFSYFATTFKLLVFVLNSLFFFNLIFKLKLFIIGKSAETFYDLAKIQDQKLPIYSIILPLYNENDYTVKGLLKSISNLDYPKDKLDVKIVVEQFDRTTLSCLRRLRIPNFAEIICVRSGMPKTKPKACNYALRFVKGKFVVIFDAEDRPEAQQLKKSIYNFITSPPEVICLQAKVNFYNKRLNLLTRLMSVEYRMWFERYLMAQDKIDSPVTLGGTSNHFKVKELRRIGGWDSFNVTEDADLGIRLYKRGYKAKMFHSTTLEEAPADITSWLKQRSRWLKGHIQTYLVHLRTLKLFFNRRNYFSFMNFNFFLLIPLLAFLYPVVFCFYFLLVIFFNLNFSYYSYIAIINIGLWLIFCWASFYILAKNMNYYWRVLISFLSPFYFGIHSVAALMAVVEIIIKPHYWRKTTHIYREGIFKAKFNK